MKTPKILLVDDENEFVTTLSERLELRGIQVASAMNGDAALKAIQQAPPDVVVMDVLMPGINGLEVLKQIKDCNPQIQVILLSGRGSSWEGEEGVRLGAFDYMIKPVDIDQLIEKMNRAAGR